MRGDHRIQEIGGIATSIYDTGSRAEGSRTVVMVHGGDPRSLSNALDWSTIWDGDALGSRLVAYDKPGQGLSCSRGLSPFAMTAEGLSAHLEALLQTLDGRVCLMGHSRGALPVAEVALRRPDLVDSVVLVSSNTLAPVGVGTPAEFYPAAYADPPVAPTVEYLRREPTMNSYSTAHIDEEFIAGRLRAALENGWWAARHERTAIFRDRVLPSLDGMRGRVLETIASRGFGMPVLQLWGQNDVSAPIALAHELFASIAATTPEATSIVINESAHYLYREHPARFIAAVRAFLF